MSGVTGPFRTFHEATEASGYGRSRAQLGGPEPITALNARDLAEAVAGLELGAYDQKIIGWLAEWEPATVAVICGLISRAREAGA